MQKLKYFKSSAIVVLAVITFGAFQEIAIRLAMPAFNPANHIRFVQGDGDTPTLGPRNSSLRQIKNTGDFDVGIKFNKYGFRDSKDLKQSKPNDWFVVGDSYPFGWGVEEKQRLGEQLELLAGVNFFNISSNGDIDTYEQLIDYGQRQGAEIRNVLLVLTMESDFRIYSDRANPVKSKKPTPPELMPSMLGVKSYLTAHSSLYFIVTAYIHRVPWLKNLAVRLELITPNQEGVRSRDISEEVIQSTAKRLKKLARKFNLIAILNPSRALWLDKYKKSAEQVHQAFANRLVDLGVKFVDLKKEFERRGELKKVYFKNDPHWTPEGHYVAAKTIYSKLGESDFR